MRNALGFLLDRSLAFYGDVGVITGQKRTGTTGKLREKSAMSRSDEDEPTQAPNASQSPTLDSPLPSEGRRAAPALAPGARFGPYLLQRLLGRGGMGEVWEAEQVGSRRRVALKVLRQGLGDAAERARFLREGRLAASVNHPNSVYVFGSEEIDGAPAITMELLTGGTLKDVVGREGAFSPARAVDAILQVVAGLEAASSVGVLHRDMKPSNCFLDTSGTVKVGDFGLSVSTLARPESHLTMTGSFLGTPAYASPEQVRCDALDVRSDIYAVGATLYFLLTGKAPFDEGQLGRMLAAALEKAPTPPRRLREAIPRDLERIVLRCLEKDPARRHQNYAALRAALEPFASTAPAAATLGLRLAAGTLDEALLATLGILFLMPAVDSFVSVGRSPGTSVGVELASLFVVLVYFAVLEGFGGASVGKRLCGLRVVRPGARRPGPWVAVLRAAVYRLPDSVPSLLGPLLGLDESTGRGMLLAMVIRGLGLVILFASVRRRNGFAGLHELVSGTRVIVRVDVVPAEVPAAERSGEAPIRADRKIGPYAVRGTLREDGDERLLLGFDETLRRPVWIVVSAPETPPVPDARRDLARAGRLRWLAGFRGERDAWDVYEAAEGQSLAVTIRERHDWATVRWWLLDLAEEVRAASTEDLPSPTLALERVWITPRGRARLLDFAGPRSDDPAQPALGSGGRDLASAQAFLAAVGEAAAKSPLPLHATAFLRLLGTAGFASFDDLRAAVAMLQVRPAAVSRRRRGAQLLMCVAPALALCGSLLIDSALASAWRKTHPEPALVLRCLKELDIASGAGTPRTLGRRLGLRARSLIGGRGDRSESPETLAARRDHLEIYLVGRHRAAISDEALALLPLGMRSVESARQDRRLSAEALAHHPHPSEVEVAMAEKALAPFLERVRQEIASPPWWHVLGAPIFGLALTLGIPGTLALVLALVIPGGLLLRLFGIALVDRKGNEVTRWLSFRRAVVVWWAPLLLASGLYGTALQFFAGPLGRPTVLILAYILFSVSLCGAYLAGIVVALANPQQGLQDRFLGTYLVPR